LRDNQPVAKIIPIRRHRQWIPAAELIPRLEGLGPDLTGLTAQLSATMPDTTDELA